MSTLCKNCGFDNPPGMRFCGNCGSRLAPEEPASTTGRGQAGGSIRIETGSLNPRAVSGGPPAARPPDASHLGVMTGSDLLERFRQAGLEASGQRRSVTVLFVDLTGYTHLSEQLSDETLYELIQRFIKVLADDVYKYEGMVDKLTGDGLMALFGAPIAHENNAERAIRAALDMHRDVARLSQEIEDLQGRPLQLHIGLNSGSVIVGGVGNDAIMNYTAIGDSVNLSRRLEEEAEPGTTLVSESVYRQTRRLFDFEALPPRRLKGISREVTAYRVIGPKAVPGTVRGLEGLRAPMIGRENELRQLRQAVDRLVSERQGGVILLLGEAGMGKSRITAELKASLYRDEVRILEGRSMTYRKSVAYWIFQDVLRNHLGLSADMSIEEIHQRMMEEAKLAFPQGGEWRERLPYLEYLLSVEPSDPSAAERIRYLDAGQLRQQIFLVVRDLLIAEANRRPVLLILEDLHWADDASLELLQFLLDTTRRVPLLIYAISRPFEGGAVKLLTEKARQRLASNFLTIRLQALPPEQSQELLYALLAVPDLPDSLREGIIARAAGSPFYLEEILRMLIEEQIIYSDGEHWRMMPGADPTRIGVPETLQDLILTRFDRLELPKRRVLQIAGVIGYQFNGSVLKEVLRSLPADEVQNSLDWLVEREFIQPDAGGSGEDYTFKHVLVSDAVYSTLLQRDRRELHQQVAQAIEKIYAGRLDGQVELLASHYLRSPQLDRALHYLILAGQKAARDFANEQARQHFVQALSLLSRVPYAPSQALAIHVGLGDALVIAGEYQAARDHYQTALEVLDEPDPSNPEWVRQVSDLQRKIGITFERQGDYDKAMARLLAAEELLGRDEKVFSAERSSILNDIGYIYSRRGKLDQAEFTLIRALGLAEMNGQIDVIASVLNRLGGICYQRDDLHQATQYLTRSLELREKIGDIVNVARSYNNLGLLKWKQGDLDAGLECFNRAFRLQSNLGDVEGQISLNTNMGLIEIDRGNLPASEKHFQEALATAEQIGHTFYIGDSHKHLALFYMYKEDWEAMLAHAQKGLESFQSIGVPDHELELRTFIGLAFLNLGRVAEAEAAAGRVIELLNSQPGVGGEGEGRALRLLSGLARARQDYGAARRHLEKSVADFAQVGNQMEQARSLLELADVLIACGEPARAREWLEEAHKIFERLGAKVDQHKLAALMQKL